MNISLLSSDLGIANPPIRLEGNIYSNSAPTYGTRRVWLDFECALEFPPRKQG